MKTKNTDVVAEYLHEVDVRLAGLPVLQRRELLADLAAHIAAERAERNIQTEGALIEVLERLGSPDVVAAAAHEEAGVRPAAEPPRRDWRSSWPLLVAVAGVLLMLVICGSAFAFARGGSVEPAVVQVPAPDRQPPR